MNENDLGLVAKKFPLSEATRRRNQVGCALSDPQPQPPVCHEPLGANSRKEKDPGRCKVVIVSRRKRLMDPDNLVPKYHIDALRYCGILEDDTAKHIVLEIRQEKVKVKADECTIIEITPIEKE